MNHDILQERARRIAEKISEVEQMIDLFKDDFPEECNGVVIGCCISDAKDALCNARYEMKGVSIHVEADRFIR